MMDRDNKLIIKLLKENFVAVGDPYYYEIFNKQDGLKKYFYEKLGYNLSVDKQMIALEKIPYEPKSGMGIKGFKKTTDYIIFIMILDYLEEQDIGSSILISFLVEHIVENYPERNVDWKKRRINFSMIRVLKYCQEKGILKLLEGMEEKYFEIEDEENLVLYENTGISRNLMRVLPYDLTNINNIHDITMLNPSLNPIQKARQLLLNRVVVYRDEEEYEIIEKNFEILEGEFEALFDCRLIIEEEYTLLLLDEKSSSFSIPFPNTKNISIIGMKLLEKLRCERPIENEKTVPFGYVCL